MYNNNVSQCFLYKKFNSPRYTTNYILQLNISRYIEQTILCENHIRLSNLTIYWNIVGLEIILYYFSIIIFISLSNVKSLGN